MVAVVMSTNCPTKRPGQFVGQPKCSPHCVNTPRPSATCLPRRWLKNSVGTSAGCVASVWTGAPDAGSTESACVTV